MGALHRTREQGLKPLVAFIRQQFSRRSFLQGTLASTAFLMASPILTSCGSSSSASSDSSDSQDMTGDSRPANPEMPETPANEDLTEAPTLGDGEFNHGVASGDPLSDRVIMWTRVTPLDEMITTIAGTLMVALDPMMNDIVVEQPFITTSDRDFTVKLDVAGLQPYTTYYYQFQQGDRLSAVGRTKTAPVADEVDRIRLGVVSCSNYSSGFFSAYGSLAQRTDIDLVLHLGDYIYETAGGSIRQHFPNKEITTLTDYRQRFAQYRTDENLQEAHRQFPWVTTWDDHETTNNSYADGASNHTEATETEENEGLWTVREGAAVRAYFEWMPIRDNIDTSFDAPEMGLKPDGNGKVYRYLPYGNLAEFIILDTRLAGRAIQNGTDIVSEEQTILGAEQREFFVNRLKNKQSQWTFVGQQMTFAPLKLPNNSYLNEDAWDGYRFDRDVILNTLDADQIDDVVILSGDIHATIALDVPKDSNPGYDPITGENPTTGDKSLCVEFSCSAVSNIPLPIWTALRAQNGHLKHANEVDNGYLLLDVTKDGVQGEWYYNAIRPAELIAGGDLNSALGERPDPFILRVNTGQNFLQNVLENDRSRTKESSPPAP